METLRLSVEAPDEIRKAGELLREGCLVAFPTETVYGLGARADDKDAVAELYRVKGRPAGKKCAILIPDPEDAQRHVGEMSVEEARLADVFWPGPLTLVVGGDDAIGVRCPDCEPTREMLRAADVPVYAPSANISGKPPAKNADEVLKDFEGAISAVLDGGEVPGGTPSTVVRADGKELRILRPGALARETLEAALAPDINGR